MKKVRLEQIKDSEERRFIKTILEYSQKGETQNRPFFTDFHNKDWMQTMINQYLGDTVKASCTFFGGYKDAERQMLGVCPYDLSYQAFPLTVLEVKVKTGIGKQLSHRDFLGALLGLGIERETVGDIIIKSFGAYIIIKQDMLPYIRAHLTCIGKYQNIEINEIDFEAVSVDPPATKIIQTTVASLRLDVIVAAAFNLSRGSASQLIQNDRVKCNGVIRGTSQLISQGDFVTVRGYGKMKLQQVNGYTKKDRLHITIEKYI